MTRYQRWAANHPERAAKHNTRKRSGKHKSNKRPHIETQFLAVDGEGITRDDGQHDYTLLAASDGSYIEDWSQGGLSTRECFDYLIGLRRQHRTLIGFSIGYDVNMMLRDISRDQLERIASGAYTLIQKRYLIKFIPGKMFYVGRGSFTDDGWSTETGVTIWDCWGFYQSSFVNALKEWKICSAETIDIIARMKDQRSTFDDGMTPTIRDYCIRECELLVDLMTQFRAVLDAAGIKLSRWDGAGAVAGALLRSHGIKKHIEELPLPVQNAALHAYFGGRIEIYGSGVVKEPCIEYDINSAYPNETALLPTLHGSWKRTKSYSVNPWALWRVRWHINADDIERGIIAPFPWRDNEGRVLYTLSGDGWYHAVEVDAALSCFPHADIEIVDGYVFTPESDIKPFGWIPELYAQRQVYKANGDARHIVIKLGLNAMYGKLAQTVSMNGAPPYQSFYWAGRVTAGTRAKMLYALTRSPQVNAISCMTDALFVREPLPLPISKELGEWSITTLDAGLLVVQPGVVLTPERACKECDGDGCAWCKGTGRAMFFGRSRGFYRASLDYAQALEAWRDGGFMGSWDVTETRFIGMGRALAAQRLIEWTLPDDPPKDVFGNLISEMWRRWTTCAKRIGFNANTKKKRVIDMRQFPRKRFPKLDSWQVWMMYETDGGISRRYQRRTQDNVERELNDWDMLEQVDAVRSGTL